VIKLLWKENAFYTIGVFWPTWNEATERYLNLHTETRDDFVRLATCLLGRSNYRKHCVVRLSRINGEK